jgi:hypothetical protein
MPEDVLTLPPDTEELLGEPEINRLGGIRSEDSPTTGPPPPPTTPPPPPAP